MWKLLVPCIKESLLFSEEKYDSLKEVSGKNQELVEMGQQLDTHTMNLVINVLLNMATPDTEDQIIQIIENGSTS